MIARLLAAALVAVLTALLAPSALAVLEVRPNTVAIDSEVDFVLRVHSVRAGTATQAVKVRFPDEVTGVAIASPPLGWSMRAIESDGRTIGVRYIGGIIPEGTHQDFLIRARTEVAGSSLWAAEQFYENGEVVEFSLATAQAGDRGQGPAAVVEIRGPTPAPEPGAPATPAAPREPEAPTSEQPLTVVSQPESEDGLGLLRGLGVTLLLIALAAFVAVLVLLRTRSDAAETPA
ncbi:MAG: DUF1775 domain-containing protein [Thermoleophilia bacterium]|nr:DUF1775 domain-containing protein [Thermoleophilia bacterium]MDH3724541.1 DUF1775 domain-containing protein [Thermoleophilia bacterium]